MPVAECSNNTIFHVHVISQERAARVSTISGRKDTEARFGVHILYYAKTVGISTLEAVIPPFLSLHAYQKLNGSMDHLLLVQLQFIHGQ